ncbi:hypothetical protein AWB74_08478 [Caballeronia arvi]|uniref:Uncharacterized protein n=1 Tax=Caballeronia arvi TaxID=1777135 RepID=A0A158L4F6_9BURK|nr:hypothetical protein [Caballeronia arvi]SAL88266.1 hypothetical protein AWB74_08478 [Caballeronia arvi]
MEWIHQRPTMPGYYWLRFADERSPQQTIAEISEVPGNAINEYVVILMGDDSIMELDDTFFDGGLFAGPIAPP